MKNWIWALPAVLLVVGVSAFAYLSIPSAVTDVTLEDTTSQDINEVDDAPQVIGYVGCSNTWQTIEGYHAAGGDKFWPANKNYGGGTIAAWANTIDSGSKYWAAFDHFVALYPDTDTIWWQLCVRHEEANAPYADAEKLLEAIHDRVPDAMVYVSSLPEYPDAECGITETIGIERGDALVIELLEKNPELVAGPVLQPMTSDKTTFDNCHINDESRPLLGAELKTFFD